MPVAPWPRLRHHSNGRQRDTLAAPLQRCLALILGTFLVFTAAAAAQENVSRSETGEVTARAVRIPQPIVLDGRLDEPIYQSTRPIDGFIQQEPAEGAAASEATEVWIFFDERNIYVAARCWDSQPDREVLTEMRRDQNKQRARDGDQTTVSGDGVASPFGSGLNVRKRGLPALVDDSRHHLQHEPSWQVLRL